MKIVHICMGFPVEYPGGITNYVRSLSGAQAAQGDEVIIYCNSRSESDNTNNTAQYAVKRYDSKIRPFTMDIDAKDPGYRSFYESLCAEEADVYHIHSLLGIDLRFVELFSQSSLNYIISLHDYNLICPRVFMVDKWEGICRQVVPAKCMACIGKLEQVDLLWRVYNKIKVPVPTLRSEKIYKRIYIFERLLKKASVLLPVSTRVSEIFSDFSANNLKVITIGNETANIVPERDKLKSEKIIVAFLGSFTKIKGAELFIELCKKNTNPLLEFCFYGRGKKELIDAFENAGGKNFGPYSSKSLPEVLNKIHVGAVLSIWEDNGPQVVMEMLNNAIPVLGTKRGGISDFINDHNGFLFDPDEEMQLALKWLSELTVDNVKQYHQNIKRLKTPQQHYIEVDEVYRGTLNN